jgi:hypothetical protein
VPGAKRILLGAIPLESMDLVADSVNRRLTGARGEDEVLPVL